MSEAKERLRELILTIIDELAKDDYQIQLFKGLIQGYADFYLNMITDDQAMKVLIKLDQICSAIKRANRGGRRGRGD